MAIRNAYIVNRNGTITNRVVIDDELSFTPPKGSRLIFEDQVLNINEVIATPKGDQIITRKPDIGEKLEA